MQRLDILRKALAAWDEYAVDMPNMAWVGSDIAFLLDLETRRASQGRLSLSEAELERVRHLAPPRGTMGPLGGLAVHDIPNGEVSDLLCDVQAAARKMLADFSRAV